MTYERLINGVLHWRLNEHDLWISYTREELSERVMRLENQLVEATRHLDSMQQQIKQRAGT